MTTLADFLASHVPYQRREEIAAAVLASGLVVTKDEHNEAVKKEIDWQHHWADKFEAADRGRKHLERLIDLTDLGRFQAVLRDLATVPEQRTAKHTEDCWQRHTGCLARRIHNHLTGDAQ